MTTSRGTTPRSAPFESDKARHLRPRAAAGWLRQGWCAFKFAPIPSLCYGAAVFLVSVLLVWTLFYAGVDYILFPALAGFMVVAPVLAVGLYEKARLIDLGERPTFSAMLLVRSRSGGQVFFIGVILMLVMLLWMRAAVLIYALFFGMRPFPGLDHIAGMLVTTPMGWAMLFTGTLIGGLFAAFSFAIGALSVPMLLDQRTDAFTAMGTSMATVWNNIPVMIAWGAIVVGAILLSVVTAGLALVVVFPVLGHATWYAYKAMR